MKNEKTKAAAIVVSEDGYIDVVTTATIQEKESYSDLMQEIENYACGEIQDAHFEQRFMYAEDDE